MAKHNPHDLRRIAVAASCDPRTVAKVLSGGRVQPLPESRIRAVLAAEGRAVPTPTTETTAPPSSQVA